MTKFIFELQKSHSKIDSTTTPNPLHMKIMQMTQNCRKNTGTLKRNTFIPKVTWSIVRECPPYNLSKRKCYLCLNGKLEFNSYKGSNLLNERSELINKYRHLNKYALLRHDSKNQYQSFSCKSYHNVHANIASQCLIDVLNCNLDNTSIKQLQVAAPLGMNIAKKVT